jgi:hypothetical protein
MFALFNKNKEFIGYSEDFPSLPNNQILKREIPSDKTDFTLWRWDGDYDNGSMVSIYDKQYEITEENLQEDLFERINKEYPIDLQIVILMKQIKEIASAKKIKLNNDFSKMSDMILKAVEIYEEEYKFFINQNDNE